MAAKYQDKQEALKSLKALSETLRGAILQMTPSDLVAIRINVKFKVKKAKR